MGYSIPTIHLKYSKPRKYCCEIFLGFWFVTQNAISNLSKKKFARQVQENVSWLLYFAFHTQTNLTLRPYSRNHIESNNSFAVID